MKMIPGFLLIVLLAAFLGYVFAQGFSAKGTGLFVPIEFINNDGKAHIGAPNVRVGKIDMSDGTTCYFISSKDMAGSLESLNQIVSLGCVK